MSDTRRTQDASGARGAPRHRALAAGVLCAGVLLIGLGAFDLWQDSPEPSPLALVYAGLFLGGGLALLALGVLALLTPLRLESREVRYTGFLLGVALAAGVSRLLLALENEPVAPWLSGLMYAGAGALGLSGLDRLLAHLSVRWSSSGGRSSPGRVMVVGGTAVLAGTFGYGVSYLHADEGVFSLFGSVVGVESDGRRGPVPVAVGADVFVQSCDEPVLVSVATFRRARDPGRHSFVLDYDASAFRSPEVPFTVPRPGSRKLFRVPGERVLNDVERDKTANGVRKATPVGPAGTGAYGAALATARFKAKWLRRRDSNSCTLAVPIFTYQNIRDGTTQLQEARLPSVVRVEVFPDLRIDLDASSPAPERSLDGTGRWACQGTEGACTGFAVILERNAAGDRDLHLLLLGLLFGIGSAAALEGVIAVWSRSSGG